MKITIVSLVVVVFVSPTSAAGPCELNSLPTSFGVGVNRSEEDLDLNLDLANFKKKTFAVFVELDSLPSLSIPLRVNRSGEDLLIDFANFRKNTFGGLKIISAEVGKGLLHAVAQILTDGLRLQATPQVESAFTNVSTEGLFQNLGDLILTRAREHIIDTFPSPEEIISDIGPFFTLPSVQLNLLFYYNDSAHFEGSSHEGISGNLTLKGLGGLIGGTAGNVITGTGDLFGNIFYALPPNPGVSQESITSKLGHVGILIGSGELIVKGAVKTAKDLLRSVYKPYSLLLRGPIFLARGQFNRYPNIQAPGQEALIETRNLIHHHNFCSAKVCVDAAEQNLTQLLEQYVQHGNGCVNNSYSQGEPIVHKVFDILIDAVSRVENAHREAERCFKKIGGINRCKCFNVQVPAIIDAHSEKIGQYGEQLVEFTRQFSDVNIQFDTCLAKHLGNLKREVNRIATNFHKCVDQQEYVASTTLPGAAAPQP